MHGEHGFSFYSIIPGLSALPPHMAGLILVAGLLMSTTWVARARLLRVMRLESGGLVPSSRLTFLNFFELVAEKLFMLTEMVIGKHDAPKFFPLVGSLFVIVFTGNLIGMIPGLTPPTDNLNTTLALGSFVFLYYNYIGFKSNGVGYFKHFLGPVWWLAPLMLIIELVSHLVRPLSLGLRLQGNISGDHLVLSIFSDLVPYLVPVIFYGLGFFVCFIQAFVFTLLTMVYISLASSHDH